MNVASPIRLSYLIDSCSNDVDIHINFVEDHPLMIARDGFFRFWQLPSGDLGFWTRLTVGYAEYIISKDGRTVRIAHAKEAPFLEIMRYLTGVALGTALRLRGVLCLHASAAAVGGSALVFAGPSRTGKSTLSAALHRRGYPLISEDVVALDQNEAQTAVRPGYAGIRLFPDTLNYVYGSSALDEALPVDRKVLYPLEEMPETSYSVQRIYLLAPRNPQLRTPRIRRVNKKTALLVLPGQLYLQRFFRQQWLARDFPRLGQLVEQVPVYLLERTDALSDLDATIDLVLDQHITVE